MLNSALIAALTGSIVLTGVFLWLRAAKVALQHRERMSELQVSEELLDAHQQRLEAFFQTPAPDSLKALLLSMGDTFSSREAMSAMTRIIERHVASGTTPQDRLGALDDLPADQRDLFMEAVTTGLLGTMLRWPETAKCYAGLSKLAISAPSAVVREAADAYVTVPTIRIPQPRFDAAGKFLPA